MEFNVGDLVCLKRNQYEGYRLTCKGSEQWNAEVVDTFMCGVIIDYGLGEMQGADLSFFTPVYTVQFGDECVTLPVEYFGRPTST
ncbi:hypothetical protein CMI47_14485 [Candidatus Pacearchaeota archaeon]|nr:hypothetical protein [Candidatus Pacearchaeota archaeon]